MTTAPNVSKEIQEIEDARAKADPHTLAGHGNYLYVLAKNWPTLRAALTAPPQPLPEAREVAERILSEWFRTHGVIRAESGVFRDRLTRESAEGIRDAIAQALGKVAHERDAALNELERVRAAGRAVVAGYGDELMPAVEFTRLVLALHDLTCITPAATPDAPASILTQPKENA